MNEVSRRDLLAAFLGLPFATAGCQSHVTDLPEGEIVGPSVDLGHQLRTIRNFAPSDGEWERRRVVIAGAGVAGLSAAWRLKRAGFDQFVVLELEQKPGGTSRSGQSSVAGYPWGAHYLPAPLPHNEPLIALLDEMGVFEGRDDEGSPIVAEQFLCRDPQERVYYRGKWFEGLYLYAGASAEDLRQLEQFQKLIDQWVGFRDARGRRAFTLPSIDCSDDAEACALDRVSMAQWMMKNDLTSPRLKWLVDYSCRDDYGLTAEGTSAWAGLFYFASRVAAPGNQSAPLITWPEGNGRLVNHLFERVRSHVLLGRAVADVNPTPDKTVEVCSLSSSGQRVFGHKAERVVFAGPRFVTPYVVRPLRVQKPAYVDEFEYSPWLVANLHLSSRPAQRGFPLSWDNVLYDSPSLGYVAATHQKLLDYGPTIFTYYYPFCMPDADASRQRLLNLSWEECAEIVLSDLQRAHPEIRTLCKRLDVMRWGHAMIRPRVGFVMGEERKQAGQPCQNVHFAHTDLSGMALFEEAFYHGVRAAEEVLDSLQIDFEPMYA